MYLDMYGYQWIYPESVHGYPWIGIAMGYPWVGARARAGALARARLSFSIKRVENPLEGATSDVFGYVWIPMDISREYPWISMDRDSHKLKLKLRGSIIR